MLQCSNVKIVVNFMLQVLTMTFPFSSAFDIYNNNQLKELWKRATTINYTKVTIRIKLQPTRVNFTKQQPPYAYACVNYVIN